MNSIRDGLLPGATEQDGLTAPFWMGCEEGELRVQQCQDCRQRFFTPLPACPHCLSCDWKWIASPGTGTLYSYTVVSYIPASDRSVPFVLAAVDLDDGWTMTSNVIDCDPADVRCGMRLKVCFRPDAEGRVLPQFAPAADRD